MLFIYRLKHVLLISAQPSPSSSREHPWPTPLHSSCTNSAFRLSHSCIRYHRHSKYYSWSRHYHNTKSFLISTSVSKLLTPLQSSLAQAVPPVADATHPFHTGMRQAAAAAPGGMKDGMKAPGCHHTCPWPLTLTWWHHGGHPPALHPAAAASARAGGQHSPSPPCNRPGALRGEDADHLRAIDPPPQGDPLPRGYLQPPQGDLQPPQGDPQPPRGNLPPQGD